MFLEYLALRNFRNYRELEVGLDPGVILFSGANAQGKSNLLEAVYFLALCKSFRAENEREVISFSAVDELPYSRLIGSVKKRGSESVRVQVDIALLSSKTGLTEPSEIFQKKIRVNGIPRPVSRSVGNIAAVLFSADDIKLVTGSPALRRRFLDVLLSQVNPGYLRALQHYQRVLSHRNHLLRRIREDRSGPDELGFWDTQLCDDAANLILWRRDTLVQVASTISDIYGELGTTDNRLLLSYEPTISSEGDVADIAERLTDQLMAARAKEIQVGQTLSGPHRDDVSILLEGRDAGKFASRGQLRSVALALRLAEARYLTSILGEEPLLLLDDVLSELDPVRQKKVLETISNSQQSLLTIVDPSQHPITHQYATSSYKISAGELFPGDE